MASWIFTDQLSVDCLKLGVVGIVGVFERFQLAPQAGPSSSFAPAAVNAVTQ
jgi:hypothetical protein